MTGVQTCALPICFPVTIHTMKEYKVLVKTLDGCTTIWYEKSRAKNACEIINKRVCDQLFGLALQKVEVTALGTV